MAQKLKFGNGTWATKKGSTLSYNDQNDRFKPLPFTTTRASSATRVNKEGLIEVVSNDVPRIDYTDSADGVLLLENSATNLVTYSSDLSVLSKVSLGTASTPVTTANYALAPDGTMTATRVVFDLNGGTTTNDTSLLRQSISSGGYYFSIYVKSTSGNEQKVMWHDGGEYNTTTVTNEWKRISYLSNSPITYGGIALNGAAGVDTSDILVWGFQIESGNLSSYIPTNGSTVTRVADTASGAGNSEVFNDSEGVLFANISALANDGTERELCINDSSTSNRVAVRYRDSNDDIRAIVRSSGVNTLNATIGVGSVLLYNKVALKYKVNDFAFWINGFEVATDTSGAAPSGLDVISFNDGSSSDFYGKTKEISYYDEILTDLELEYMTSYRSLNELVTELNLNEL